MYVLSFIVIPKSNLNYSAKQLTLTLTQTLALYDLIVLILVPLQIFNQIFVVVPR